MTDCLAKMLGQSLRQSLNFAVPRGPAGPVGRCRDVPVPCVPMLGQKGSLPESEGRPKSLKQ